MAYIYDWNGMPMPPVRTSELGDWPPVFNSGPERNTQASIMPPTYFHTGPVPTGDIIDGLPYWLLIGGAALAAWWLGDKLALHETRRVVASSEVGGF